MANKLNNPIETMDHMHEQIGKLKTGTQRGMNKNKILEMKNSLEGFTIILVTMEESNSVLVFYYSVRLIRKLTA